MTAAAVFVHGLWLNGMESVLLRRRLHAEQGFDCYRFTYATMSDSMSAVVQRLRSFVDAIDADVVHFVGHSLGGLVLCRYFESGGDARDGRVVLLGSPAVKSRTAERVGRLPLLSSLIGPLVIHELVSPCERTWNGRRELGLIAGTRPLGLGRFFARFDEACDGTVGVSETQLPGYKAHLCLPVSHMGMLASRSVARQVGSFLATGEFATVPHVST